MQTHLIALSLSLLAATVAAQEISPLTPAQRFNNVAGTQTFAPAYQFTDQPALLETAQAIQDMGSNVLKFIMDKNYYGERKNVPEACPTVDSLMTLARDEPTYRKIFEMPFAYYIIWVYPFKGGWWHSGFSVADQEKEYREIYDLSCHLLKTYNGTGKSFYLGHWEGDWHLRPGYDLDTDKSVTPEAVQGMIDWLNTRQRAVDDAKRDTPHADVQLFNYVEVNLTKIGMEGRPCVTTSVLPHTNVDYVSYSSYDMQHDLVKALDFIEEHLPAKEGLPMGKRVWIGEYGYPACNHSPEEQEKLSRKLMQTAIGWGCPFALYWEMFNNEVGADGVQRGFWLIDDKGEKQPLYYTHKHLFEWSKQYVADFIAATGQPPTDADYRREAVRILGEMGD